MWYLYRFTTQSPVPVCTPPELAKLIHDFNTGGAFVNNQVTFMHNGAWCSLWRDEYSTEQEAMTVLAMVGPYLGKDPSGYTLVTKK